MTDIDQTTAAFCILMLGLMAALLWVCWLYLLQYRRTRELERDNYRLIRRLGMYHSISLGAPEEALPPQALEPTVPAAFRWKKPTPPPGYKGPVRSDL